MIIRLRMEDHDLRCEPAIPCHALLLYISISPYTLILSNINLQLYYSLHYMPCHIYVSCALAIAPNPSLRALSVLI
jgi:hypothetical protein